MNKYIYITIFAVLALNSTKTLCQALKQDDVIFKAMEDELDRNITQLVYKDTLKPFFISYTIEDVKTLKANATLGAIITSDENHDRSWSNRVLAGNYQLNDENFVDNTRQGAPSDGSLELPLDNDYMGIRRALWITTNNTFKSASDNYANKLQALKDKGLSQSALQIPDFWKAPVVELNITQEPDKWDIKWLENKAKENSKWMLDYPDLIYSEVSAYQFHANVYFLSSEKTKIKYPVNLSFLVMSAFIQTDDGDRLSEQIKYYVISPNDFPSNDSLKKDIALLVKNLRDKANAKRLEDNYTGPALFLGNPVTDIFSETLFNGKSNLFAYREPLYNNSEKSMYYGDNMNSLEAKLDKLVVSKNLTIKDISTLKEYKNIPLIGSYYVDGEGVKPKDTLLLIENGILKSLYNGRTPTRSIAESNGHNRYAINSSSISHDLGPGVVFISANETKSSAELKQDLINAAKEEGLDYGILVRSIKTANYFTPVNYYKVYVADGREELIRTPDKNGLEINDLKKALGFSKDVLVYNTLLGDNSNGRRGISAMPTGMPVSFICPAGILVKEIELEKENQPLSSEKPIVKNPVVK